MVINLDANEIAWAKAIGQARQHNATTRGLRDKHGATGGLDIHLLGALGELAAAKALGIAWQPTVGAFQALGGDGVANYEVRTAGKHHLSLIIRDSDAPDRIYVLVTTEDRVTFQVHGWMIAGTAKAHPEWRRAPGGREAAYFVPQSALSDIRWLPKPSTFEPEAA